MRKQIPLGSFFDLIAEFLLIVNVYKNFIRRGTPADSVLSAYNFECHLIACYIQSDGRLFMYTLMRTLRLKMGVF